MRIKFNGEINTLDPPMTFINIEAQVRTVKDAGDLLDWLRRTKAMLARNETVNRKKSADVPRP